MKSKISFQGIIDKQNEFSTKTFGPARGDISGVLKHLEEEMEELRLNPKDVSELADCCILCFELARNMGVSPEDLETAILVKQEKNAKRTWPDYRNYSTTEKINHIKSTASHDLIAGEIVVVKFRYDQLVPARIERKKERLVSKDYPLYTVSIVDMQKKRIVRISCCRVDMLKASDDQVMQWRKSLTII